MARLQCHRERTRGRLSGKTITMHCCLPSRENRAKLGGRGCLPQQFTHAGCGSSNRKLCVTQWCGKQRSSMAVPVAQPDPTSCRRGAEPCWSSCSSKSQPPREMGLASSMVSEHVCWEGLLTKYSAFSPVAPLRARRDLIFNLLSVQLSRFLVEWLLSLQEQPALLALSPPVTAYFAWHPLIREQDRLCAQGTFRVSKFCAPVPASRPGPWHMSLPAQDERGVPVAPSSSPPTHSINIKAFPIKQKCYRGAPGSTVL